MTDGTGNDAAPAKGAASRMVGNVFAGLLSLLCIFWAIDPEAVFGFAVFREQFLAPVLGLMLNLELAAYPPLVATMLVGTPAISFIGTIAVLKFFEYGNLSRGFVTRPGEEG